MALCLCESTCGCSNRYLNLWQLAWITIQLTIVNKIIVILDNCQNEKLATPKTHSKRQATGNQIVVILDDCYQKISLPHWKHTAVFTQEPGLCESNSCDSWQLCLDRIICCKPSQVINTCWLTQAQNHVSRHVQTFHPDNRQESQWFDSQWPQWSLVWILLCVFSVANF